MFLFIQQNEFSICRLLSGGKQNVDLNDLDSYTFWLCERTHNRLDKQGPSSGMTNAAHESGRLDQGCRSRIAHGVLVLPFFRGVPAVLGTPYHPFTIICVFDVVAFVALVLISAYHEIAFLASKFVRLRRPIYRHRSSALYRC
jgi:hypothetical protein